MKQLLNFDKDTPNTPYKTSVGNGLATIISFSDFPICLTPTTQVNVINSNGNKYLFNNETTYNVHSYGLAEGTYTFTNIPSEHPMAILNDGDSNITYTVVDDTPIIINVSGGNSSSPYYDFTDENGNAIDIFNGIFRFMRGRTYKFKANGISRTHPFRIHTDDGDSPTISESSGEIDITINANQSTNLYYQCANHTGMKGNLQLLNQSVSNTTNDATYDFYYGDITVTVGGDFGTVSVYCYYHGYMGGENLLVYKSSCS